MRRILLALFGALAASLCLAASPNGAARNLEDFDAMWRAIDQGYAYFDGKRGAWKRAREAWRPKAGAAKSRQDFVRAVEGAIATLRDDSVTLSESVSLRPIPAETDIWAQWKDGSAVITSVRVSGEADVAGLHPGHVVTHIDGVPVARVARDDWALRQALAGPRAGRLRMSVRDARASATLEIERKAHPPANGPPLIARRMGDERDIGYIRIRNSLADARLAEAFDGALNYLKDSRSLILDLRETPNGGRRDVVDAILASLKTYPANLLVLVDRWTAGEGEMLAATVAAQARATLVGTPTAGIRGEPREVKLPQSGLVVRFPAKRSVLPDGRPRESLTPAVAVDLAAPSGGPGDPILYQALKLAERR